VKTPGTSLTITAAAIRSFYISLFALNALLILVTALSDLHLPLTQSGIVLQFDLKLERNIATWYSSTLLFLAAWAAFAISRLDLAETPAFYRRVWLLVALSFAGLSLDETAQIHEKVGVMFTRRFGTIPGLTTGSAYPVFAWIVVFLPLIVGFIVIMFVIARWSLSLHGFSRKLIFAGIGCWIGVLIAETVEAQLMRLSVSRSLEGAVEEGLEIVGSTCFLIAFVEFFRSQVNVVRFIADDEIT
jgi:hypothetical protein